MSHEEKARIIRREVVKLAKTNSALSVNEIRIVLALERVVARLNQDAILEKRLVYKGGFVLLKSFGSQRFTRDLDAMGLDIEKDEASKRVPIALTKDLDDGFWYGDVQTESLDGQGEYGALRFNAAFQIGGPPEKKDAVRKLSRIHFDIGFGDSIPKKLTKSEMPMMLKGDEPITWRIYPREYIFSEKLQTLVSRGSANSRAKDVHDLAMLFAECEPAKLRAAIKQTFKTRGTELPSSFMDFAKSFDTRVLSFAWGSVHLGEDEATFDETWKRLCSVLAKLDSVLESNLLLGA